MRLRQRQAYEQTNDLIDKLLAILTQTKASLPAAAAPMNIDAGNSAAPSPLPPQASSTPILAPMMQQVQALQVAQKLSNEQKDMNAAIARVVKAIERGYPNEIPEFLFEYPPMDTNLLSQVL